jgi:hypothetical protein
VFGVMVLPVILNEKKKDSTCNDLPYYKIQYWDEFSICWVYIHKTFSDSPKAENFVLTIGKKYKIGNEYGLWMMRNGERPIKTSGIKNLGAWLIELINYFYYFISDIIPQRIFLMRWYVS